LGGDCNNHIFFLLAKAWQGVLLTEQYVLLSMKALREGYVNWVFAFLDDFCYFEFMLDDQIEKAKRYLQTGGIIAAIIVILITLFIRYLYKYTFICLDPEICEKIEEPMLQIPP
jgi:hypothetical protein